MNAFTASLLILIAVCVLFLVAMPKAEAPRIPRIQPMPAGLVVNCGEERDRVCRAQRRMEKIKQRTPT